MQDDGVPVNVGDGFRASFDPDFTGRFGLESLFVRTLSDYWTLAMARMLRAKGRLEDDAPVALFSDEEALDVLRALYREHDGLKAPLLQEPLGLAPPGAIEAFFQASIGPETFPRWLEAFERRDFERCREITQRIAPEGAEPAS